MEKKLNLLCLPFAGGSKYAYRELFTNIPSIFNVMVFEYPGRGTRINEDLCADAATIVDDLYKQALTIIHKGEYAIYGHSLGGMLAHLLALKLVENNQPLPVHIFITGTPGPSAPSRTTKKRHLLPKKEFIAEVKSLGGMPDEILASEDMLDFLEPILRNDFKLSETYNYSNKPALNIPLTVITGTDEDLEKKEILLWEKESNSGVEFIEMEGNHFFILQHQAAILQTIQNTISKLIKSPYHG
ncbi:alpha/beta fold hydrolase [Mucilaginibacter gynuensis]|uniref:Alpha/beta fold hydrolase n=1 Tax=Mucilaginibacter gynuensis TaxID=1302236 RepID=A0ABP8G3J3_9SPHI